MSSPRFLKFCDLFFDQVFDEIFVRTNFLAGCCQVFVQSCQVSMRIQQQDVKTPEFVLATVTEL